MDNTLPTDLRFHRLLLGFDRDLARIACTEGCSYCRGVLHSARYWRKPRGLPVGLDEEYRQRFSFCCAVEECRKRKTPTSLRFLGPKVYDATIIVLVSALRGGAKSVPMRRLQELVGVSRRTVTRWQRWWRETFVGPSGTIAVGTRVAARPPHKTGRARFRHPASTLGG